MRPVIAQAHAGAELGSVTDGVAQVPADGLLEPRQQEPVNLVAPGVAVIAASAEPYVVLALDGPGSLESSAPRGYSGGRL